MMWQEPRHTWSQPICEDDWWNLNPDREPVRLREPKRETCAWCGKPTESGIYVRRNPKSVRFPAVEDDE